MDQVKRLKAHETAAGGTERSFVRCPVFVFVAGKEKEAAETGDSEGKLFMNLVQSDEKFKLPSMLQFDGLLEEQKKFLLPRFRALL